MDNTTNMRIASTLTLERFFRCCVFSFSLAASAALAVDTDGDGLTDEYEGGWDTYDPVTVSQEFNDLVDTVLAEGSKIDESFLNPLYKNDLTLSEPAEIRVTFIKEGAANRNALGYYTYSEETFKDKTKGDIDTDNSSVISVAELDALPDVEIGWVFPNASKVDSAGGVLINGDSYVLGDNKTFPAGTKIGFFLVSKGWVGDGTILQPYRSGIKPYVMFTTDFINPEAGLDTDITTDSYANNSRQVALLFDGGNRNEVIMGIEDIRRRLYSDGRIGGDQDFNDAVFSVSSTPSTSLATSGIVVANTANNDNDGDGILNSNELDEDSDGDGVLNVDDPDDDGDGIVTATEGTVDTDSDGTSNYLDLDSDNDGISDEVESAVDTDTDGQANYVDTDSDGDGISDEVEGTVDADNDGIIDSQDAVDDNAPEEEPIAPSDIVITTRVIQNGYDGTPLISGDQIEYTITVANTGEVDASNIVLTGIVPENTTFVSGVSDGTIASLLAGESTTLSLVVSVNEIIPSDANKIISSVQTVVDGVTIFADNDVSGHCGITDDGVDSIDIDDLTDNDDPTTMPLMQGVVFESSILAFEDLQNAGWCDWDMNDLILDIVTYFVIDSNNNVEQITSTHQILARGAAFESTLKLDIAHNGASDWHRMYVTNTLELEEMIYGSDTDGSSIELWASSKDALPPYTDLKHKWGAAATEFFDDSDPGKIAISNVYLHNPETNPLDTFEESPFDTWIWVHPTQQAIHRLSYNLASSQTVYEGPLYGRSLPFVAKFNSDFVWPAEGQKIWLSHPQYVDFIKSGGTSNQEWYKFENAFEWRIWFDRDGMMNDGGHNWIADDWRLENYVSDNSK